MLDCCGERKAKLSWVMFQPSPSPVVRIFAEPMKLRMQIGENKFPPGGERLRSLDMLGEFGSGAVLSLL